MSWFKDTDIKQPYQTCDLDEGFSYESFKRPLQKLTEMNVKPLLTLITRRLVNPK